MNLFKKMQKYAANLLTRPIAPMLRRKAHPGDRQQKAARKNNWPLWLRLQMAAGRHLKKPTKRDTSGHGARRYDELERLAKLRRRGLI